MIEPMIEPIFVILGILASVAIPRLAATREDAEISAAVANLRTLVSDASAYLAVQGNFNGARWNAITNVPLVNTNATPTAYLKVGGKGCIGVRLANKAAGGNAPAYIHFTKVTGNSVNGSVCPQVQAAAPVKAYLDSTVASVQGVTGAIAIGSSTKIY